jgi:phage tail sheath protein FI
MRYLIILLAVLLCGANRYNKRITLIVPAAKVKAVNTLFERHGYGPNNVSVPVVAKTATKDAKPSHFYLECPADSGMAALVERVLKAEDCTAKRVTDRKVRVLTAELDKANLKRKPAEQEAEPIDREPRR